MKIKLITFAPHPNFGTCLQSYALNYVLRKMGHDVEFIYNGRENPPQSFIKVFMKGCIKLFLPKSFIASMKVKRQAGAINRHREPYILELPNHPFLYRLSKLPFYKTVYNGLLIQKLRGESVLTYFFVGFGTFTFAAYKSTHSPPFLQSYIFNYGHWVIVVWWGVVSVLYVG